MCKHLVPSETRENQSSSKQSVWTEITGNREGQGQEKPGKWYHPPLPEETWENEAGKDSQSDLCFLLGVLDGPTWTSQLTSYLGLVLLW